MSTKLSTDQINKARRAGAQAFRDQRLNAPQDSNISIPEMYHWTEGWIEAKSFAERQKQLDIERKKIASETRYAFLVRDDDGVVHAPSTQAVDKPEDIAAWARTNGYSGWVIPVVGDFIGAQPVSDSKPKARKVKPKITPKAAG